MAVSSEVRRSDRYVGDSVQKDFPFEFKVFEPEQIRVVVADESGAESDLDDAAYSVYLSPDQDNDTGGTVTLAEPLPTGQILVVMSAVPALQPTVFTNRGGFFPEVLNDSNDRAVILVQQLKERIDRALSVPVTSDRTPSQVITEILDIAAQANGFAQLAQKTYEETLETKSLVDQTRVHVDQLKALVDASEAEVEEDRIEVEQMLHDAQKVNAVTEKFLPAVDELAEVGNSIEDIRAVASELQGLPIGSIDLGYVRDDSEPIYDTSESNIALLAKHLEAIRTVVANLDTIKTALPSALRAEQAAVTAVESASEAVDTVERVKEIEKTNFEQIYENGAD